MQLDYGVQRKACPHHKEMSRGAWGCCLEEGAAERNIIFAALLYILSSIPQCFAWRESQNGCGMWDYKSTAIAAKFEFGFICLEQKFMESLCEMLNLRKPGDYYRFSLFP